MRDSECSQCFPLLSIIRKLQALYQVSCVLLKHSVRQIGAAELQE